MFFCLFSRILSRNEARKRKTRSKLPVNVYASRDKRSKREEKRESDNDEVDSE